MVMVHLKIFQKVFISCHGHIDFNLTEEKPRFPKLFLLFVHLVVPKLYTFKVMVSIKSILEQKIYHKCEKL